jgi:hypothetical protein
MHPPRRQPAGKRRIKRFNAERQARRTATPLNPDDIAAQRAKPFGAALPIMRDGIRHDSIMLLARRCYGPRFGPRFGLRFGLKFGLRFGLRFGLKFGSEFRNSH